MTDGNANDQDASRLRRAPAERFEGASHHFDLGAVAARLRNEDHPARHGHRQMTLFQRGHLTHVVFVFDRDGHLAEHSAPGLVTIHTHAGLLAVTAEGEVHELGAGQMLVLAPGIKHDVRAREDSVMLLTVHLNERRPT